MGNRKFTLIELHVDGTRIDGGSITDALPIGGTAAEDEADSEDDEAAVADDSGGRGSAIGAVIALAVLVGLGVAAKKYRDDDDEAPEPEDEPDVIVN